MAAFDKESQAARVRKGAPLTRPFERVYYPQSEYELIPKCRECHATFREQADLIAQPTQHPKHKISFVKKQYKEVNEKWATAERLSHKCRVCAEPFASRKLEEHMEKRHHNRARKQGIVPRWKKDNCWYQEGDRGYSLSLPTEVQQKWQKVAVR